MGFEMIKKNFSLLLMLIILAQCAGNKPPTLEDIYYNSPPSEFLENPIIIEPQNNVKLDRADVISRAKIWVDQKVPYSFLDPIDSEKFVDGYRPDCSGFVSFAWGLDRDDLGGANTTSLPDYSVDIMASELLPGDILLMQMSVEENGHAVIFVKWLNEDKTEFLAYEQNGYLGGAVETVQRLEILSGEIYLPNQRENGAGPYKAKRYILLESNDSFDMQSNHLLSLTSDGVFSVLDPETLSRTEIVLEHYYVDYLLAEKSSVVMAINNENIIDIFDLTTGTILSSWNSPDLGIGLLGDYYAISPQGDTVVIINGDIEHLAIVNSTGELLFNFPFPIKFPKFSLDGQTIYFFSEGYEEGNVGVYAYDFNGGDVSTIFVWPVGEQLNEPLQLSKAYYSDNMTSVAVFGRQGIDDKNGKYFYIDLLGTRRSRLANGGFVGIDSSGWSDTGGNWNHTGEYFVFMKGKAYLNDINVYVGPIRKGEISAIDLGELGVTPVWSPTMDQIAITTIGNGLILFDFRTREIREVLVPIENQNVVGLPALWSPDGQWIYFRSEVINIRTGVSYEVDILEKPHWVYSD